MMTRIRALRERHRTLERTIRQELKRPAPDSFRLTTLKKIRLRIKDELRAVMRAMSFQNSASKRA